jgi:hypothetical protein
VHASSGVLSGMTLQRQEAVDSATARRQQEASISSSSSGADSSNHVPRVSFTDFLGGYAPASAPAPAKAPVQARATASAGRDKDKVSKGKSPPSTASGLQLVPLPWS